MGSYAALTGQSNRLRVYQLKKTDTLVATGPKIERGLDYKAHRNTTGSPVTDPTHTRGQGGASNGSTLASHKTEATVTEIYREQRK